MSARGSGWSPSSAFGRKKTRPVIVPRLAELPRMVTVAVAVQNTPAERAADRETR